MTKLLIVESDQSRINEIAEQIHEIPNLVIVTARTPTAAASLLRAEKYDKIVVGDGFKDWRGVTFFSALRYQNQVFGADITVVSHRTMVPFLCKQLSVKFFYAPYCKPVLTFIRDLIRQKVASKTFERPKRPVYLITAVRNVAPFRPTEANMRPIRPHQKPLQNRVFRPIRVIFYS